MNAIYSPPPRDQRNANIDCLKALCACFVVFRHTPFFSPWHDAITLPAVPCFFMISGFFIFNQDEEKFQQRILKNLKNILKITFWASIFYFSCKIFHFFRHGIITEDLISSKKIIAWIVYNNWPFIGPLWYLFAYIYVLIIHYFLSKWHFTKYVRYAIIPLLLGFLFLGKYSFLIFGENLIGYKTHNWLFDGLPFFTLGMLIKEKFDFIQQKIHHTVIIMIISLLLSSVEMVLFVKNGLPVPGRGDLFIFTPFYAVALFLTFLLAPPAKENWFSRIGRDLSLYIYIFHIFVALVFYKVENLPDCLFKEIFDLAGGIFILVATIIFSYVFVKVKDKIFNTISLMHHTVPAKNKKS